MTEKIIKPNATYSEIRKGGDQPLEFELNRGPEYWEYRKKWNAYPMEQVVPEAPLHLDIENTNLCNLKCVMCMRTNLVRKGKLPLGSMKFDFFTHLIDQGADAGVCSVKFNYLGEPLMHPDVVEQVAYAKKKGFFEVLFNTNAVLLDRSMSKALLDAGLDSIFFSVDSPYPEKYNRIRVGADFYQVKQNIENFIRIKNNGGYKHVQTRIGVVLMDQSDEELEALRKMFLDLVGIIGFGGFNDSERDYEGEIVTGFSCAQPFQRMFVTWDGYVIPCCVGYSREMIMGNAHETPLIDIWHNEKYRHLREHMKSGTYHKIQLCKSCYMPYA